MNTVKGWETKRFDEIGTIFSGSTPSTSIRSFWDGEIVWVTPNDLSKLNTPYLCDSGKRITEKGLKGCSAHLLPAGSLVMSSRAPIGYVALPTVQFCTNQGCKTIKLKSAFHPEFTYYNVLFNIDKVKNLGEGTTFAEISKTALSTVELSFPTSMPEQAKIAEVLSTADRAIEQTEALIAKQQCIKTGLMQDLLTRGIDEHGNLRSEQTHKFKDSPLGRIPVEWDVKQLGFLCELIKDGTHLPPARVSEGPLLLGVYNIVNGKLTRSSSDTRVSWDFYRQMHQNWSIQTDDVLLAIVGATIGKTCLAPSDFEPYILQRSVALIRGKQGVLNNRFLLQYLKSPLFQSIIHTKTNTTAQAGLYLSQIADFNFPICPIEEQIAITAKLEEIGKLGESYQQTAEKLRSLKTALMQDLLTGEKRVTPLLTEPQEAGA